MGNKTRLESYALAIEAERRARAGQSFPSISRALGVPLGTLNYWALNGRFRRCDLEEETACERAKLVIERIRKEHVREAAQKEEILAQLRSLAAQLQLEIGETKILEKPACTPEDPEP